ncbi:hypothetical protein [Sphingomonas hankookensis]
MMCWMWRAASARSLFACNARCWRRRVSRRDLTARAERPVVIPPDRGYTVGLGKPERALWVMNEETRWIVSGVLFGICILTMAIWAICATEWVSRPGIGGVARRVGFLCAMTAILVAPAEPSPR